MSIDQDFEKMKKNIMKYIYFHRFARKITLNFLTSFISFILLVFFSGYLILYKYSEIGYGFMKFFSKYFSDYKIESLSLNFFNYRIELYYLVVEGRYPGYSDIINSILIFGLLGLVLFFFRQKILPFYNWYLFFLVPLFSSVLFFIFLPNYFAYTVREFSILYVLLQFGITLFFISFISFSISIVTVKFIQVFINVVFVFLFILYSYLFSYLRYFIFLLILNNFSYLYMANLFFTFGPLLDFIYIASFYSLYISWILKLIYKDPLMWKFID